jgi:hypothetical protein
VFPSQPENPAPSLRAERILVVQYSQTGQQLAALDALLGPLLEAGVPVHRETLRTSPAYPYPWPFWKFLDTFPETVTGDAPALEPLTIPPGAEFGLVIIAYPVWFLSPPPALTAFLLGDDARRLLRGRPVITLTACRNMWIMAQEKIKTLLAGIGARHCDHITLTDRGNAFASFITTPRWLLTGRKNRFWGLPPAGVSERDIHGCARFGRAILSALRAPVAGTASGVSASASSGGASADTPAGALGIPTDASADTPDSTSADTAIATPAAFSTGTFASASTPSTPAAPDAAPAGTPLLAGLRACMVDVKLIASERVGARNFHLWAKILRACGRPGSPPRNAMLLVFTAFFLALILTVVPASVVLKTLFAPLLRKKLARAAALYEQPSGSGGERLALFS